MSRSTRILTIGGIVVLAATLLFGCFRQSDDAFKLPGEKDGIILTNYTSPNHQNIARVGFKVQRVDDSIERSITWVEVGPFEEERGYRIFTMLNSLCVSVEWRTDRQLDVYYWGRVDSVDSPPVDAWQNVSISYIAIAGPKIHDPSKPR
jgi:hypothetical protein